MSSRNVLSVFIVLVSLGAAAAEAGVDDGKLNQRELQALMERARVSLRSSLKEWGGHSFERRVLREKIDGSGNTTWSTSYVFRVTPLDEGFDEELLEIDGRAPTSTEIRKHRRAERFTRHYKDASSERLGNPLGADLPLAPLLFDQEHFVIGPDTVGGVKCVRLGFLARPAVRGFDAEARLKRSLKGSLCITRDAGDLVAGRVESQRPVGQGVYKLESLLLEFESRTFGKLRLPSRFEVRTVIRVGPRWLRKHNRYLYTSYQRP